MLPFQNKIIIFRNLRNWQTIGIRAGWHCYRNLELNSGRTRYELHLHLWFSVIWAQVPRIFSFYFQLNRGTVSPSRCNITVHLKRRYIVYPIPLKKKLLNKLGNVRRALGYGPYKFSRSVHYCLLCSTNFTSIKLACYVYTINCFFSTYFTDNTPSVANLRPSDASSTSVAQTEQSVYIIRASILNPRRSSCKMPVFVQF